MIIGRTCKLCSGNTFSTRPTVCDLDLGHTDLGHISNESSSHSGHIHCMLRSKDLEDMH